MLGLGSFGLQWGNIEIIRYKSGVIFMEKKIETTVNGLDVV